MNIKLLASAALVSAAGALHGQALSYTTAGFVYNQNFFGLAAIGSGSVTSTSPISLSSIPGVTNTGVTGWVFRNDRGSSTSSEFRAQDGSLSGSAGRGVVSFGSTGTLDRALGILATSNQIPTFALFLQNNTGITLSSVTLSYTGEQWRVGDVGLTSQLQFGSRTYASYASASLGPSAGYTGNANLDFVAPFTGTSVLNNSATNGNVMAYQSARSTTFAVNWANGEILALQWVGFDLSGQDSGLAIDNLSFSAIPEPSTYAAILGGAALLFSLRRRRSAV